MAEEPKIDEPSSQRNFLRELIDDAFDLRHGLWQTFLTLFVNPRKVVRAYNDDTLANFYSPIKYVLLSTALLTFLLYAAIDFDAIVEQEVEALVKQEEQVDVEGNEQDKMYATQITAIYNKLSNEYSSISVLFLLLPSMALFSFLFFRGRIPRFSQHMQPTPEGLGVELTPLPPSLL
jgi:hypothetical protein